MKKFRNKTEKNMGCSLLLHPDLVLKKNPLQFFADPWKQGVMYCALSFLLANMFLCCSKYILLSLLFRFNNILGWRYNLYRIWLKHTIFIDISIPLYKFYACIPMIHYMVKPLKWYSPNWFIILDGSNWAPLSGSIVLQVIQL